jgi:hypothetical protein
MLLDEKILDQWRKGHQMAKTDLLVKLARLPPEEQLAQWERTSGT